MLALIDFSLSLNHIVKGTRIIEAIMEFVPDVNIEDLPIPYCAVATDLKSGREVMFRKGSLFKAIRASISLPSFYEPVKRNDMILIDGGIINPLPLNRVKRQNGDMLVGVDVSGHDYKAQWDELQRLTDCHWPAKGIAGYQQIRSDIEVIAAGQSTLTESTVKFFSSHRNLSMQRRAQTGLHGSTLTSADDASRRDVAG